MRINNVGPQLLIPPEVRGSVDQVRATQSITSRGTAAYAGGRILVESMALQPAPAAVIQERRQTPRRADDRRKQQLPVLIDTRVAQRRTMRRRADDEPAGSIDVEA